MATAGGGNRRGSSAFREAGGKVASGGMAKREAETRRDAIENLRSYFRKIESGVVKPPAKFSQTLRLSAKQPGMGKYKVTDLDGCMEVLTLAGFVSLDGAYARSH